MATKIEWATRVWNPVTGCSRGCRWCYARRFAERMKHHPNPSIANKYCRGFKPTVHYDQFYEPRKWRNPQRVFVCSMGDLFDPIHTNKVFESLIQEMSVWNGKHTFMLLTRNPLTMLHFSEIWCENYRVKQLPDNIWCGVSASNQEEANRLIPELIQVPAAVRFVSIEPMTGPIRLMHTEQDQSHYHNFLTGEYKLFPIITKTPKLDWVIVGGMTGPGSIPMHPQWVRSIKDECLATNTPFFFKSWGDWVSADFVEGRMKSSRWKWIDFKNGDLCNALDPFPEANETHHHELMARIGRKKAGHLLDGIEYRQFPETKK